MVAGGGVALVAGAGPGIGDFFVHNFISTIAKNKWEYINS